MTDAPAADPGTTLALLAGLLDDASFLAATDPDDPVALVAAHRRARRSPLVGALHVPVSRLGALLDALDAAPSSDPVDVVLVADTGLVEAAEARAVLLDDDRVAPVGLVVTLPLDGPLDESARLTLESLDFALPAIVDVPPAPGWDAAVAVLAEDGAERVGLRVGPVLADHLVRSAAAGARTAVLGAAPSLVAGPDGRPGLLNVLAAASAAVRGDTDRVAPALVDADIDALLAELAGADPRAVRARLSTVAVVDPSALVAALHGLGVVEDEDS